MHNLKEFKIWNKATALSVEGYKFIRFKKHKK